MCLLHGKYLMYTENSITEAQQASQRPSHWPDMRLTHEPCECGAYPKMTTNGQVFLWKSLHLCIFTAFSHLMSPRTRKSQLHLVEGRCEKQVSGHWFGGHFWILGNTLDHGVCQACVRHCQSMVCVRCVSEHAHLNRKYMADLTVEWKCLNILYFCLKSRDIGCGTKPK